MARLKNETNMGESIYELFSNIYVNTQFFFTSIYVESWEKRRASGFKTRVPPPSLFSLDAELNYVPTVL